MKTPLLTLIILLPLLLTGCTQRWVNLDNTEATAEQIAKSKVACRVEERLAILEAELKIYDYFIASAETAFSRDSVKRNRRKKVREVQTEIEMCMLTQGLKQQ